MKKILYGTTALIAAGMISTAVNAAEPIKLQLGGFMDWYVASSSQESSYKKALSNAVAGDGSFNQFDIMGDGEVHFKGSTMLDNGMKVGAHFELEAGTGDTRYGDESYVTVDTAYGRVFVGATRNAASKMHVSAPEVGRLALEETKTTWFVLKPANVTMLDATWLNTDGRSNKIGYISPTMYGLTMGATWSPGTDVTGNDRADRSLAQVAFKESYSVNLMYSEEFNGLGVTATAAYGATNAGGKEALGEYSVGSKLTYAGFSLGGAYRMVNDHSSATSFQSNAGWDRRPGTVSRDGYVWNLGAGYEAGPYAVSLNYMKSEVEGIRAANPAAALAKKDKFEQYMLSGKYNLGAGVDTFASVAQLKYTDETVKTTNPLNHNEGWLFATGIALAF